MSFLARANRAFKYELVSCVRAKHLIGFVHLSPFARRLLRRTLTQLPGPQAMEMLVKKLGETPSNAAFLERIAIPVK